MKIRRWVYDYDAFNEDKKSPLEIILTIILLPIFVVLAIVALPFIYLAKFIRGISR